MSVVDNAEAKKILTAYSVKDLDYVDSLRRRVSQAHIQLALWRLLALNDATPHTQVLQARNDGDVFCFAR